MPHSTKFRLRNKRSTVRNGRTTGEVDIVLSEDVVNVFPRDAHLAILAGRDVDELRDADASGLYRYEGELLFHDVFNEVGERQ